MPKDEYIFGFHAVRQVFETDISRIMELWVDEARHDNKLHAIISQARQQGLSVQFVPKKTLDKLTQEGHHQGIVLRCKTSTHLKLTLEECLATLTVPPFLLVLDEVQDPHNLGACLRTADATGVHAVIIPKDRSCSLSPTVRKVASGAAETIPLIEVTNLARTLRWLQEQKIWLVGTDVHAQTSLFATSLTGPLAVVLGTEASGLRRLTRETCDVLVKIPMQGQIETLNVSVATGVCLYEAFRQRSQVTGGTK